MLAGEDMSKAADFASLLNGGVDDALTDLLTPGQKEAHDALQKRELANKVEATALKNLAKLSFLDLSQEQKDAAYDIPSSKAEKAVAKSSPEAAMVSFIGGGRGIDFDLDDLGIPQ